MKKWVAAVLLAGLTGGLVLVNRSIGAWHFIATAPPGEVLLADGFDGSGLGWSVFDDGRLSARMADSALVLEADAASSGVFSTQSTHFADFDLTATLSAIEGPLDNAFGVIFRLQDNDNARTGDDSYFLFTISSDGYYRVTRTLNGQESVLSNWIPSPLVAQGLGAVNTVRVLATRDTFRFFINGEPVQLCIPDDPAGISTYAMDSCIQGQMLDALTAGGIASGQVGAAALATQSGGGGVVVQMQDIVMLAPAEGA